MGTGSDGKTGRRDLWGGDRNVLILDCGDSLHNSVNLLKMTDVYTSHDRILQYANHASKKLQKKKK